MWTNDDIAEVLEHLRVQGNDDARFEAKSCARTIGTSVWESVSAFANTKGGVLLLGISEDGDFSPFPDASRTACRSWSSTSMKTAFSTNPAILRREGRKPVGTAVWTTRI